MPVYIDRAVNEVTPDSESADNESLDPRWRRLQEIMSVTEAKEREHQRFAAEGFDD